MNLKYLARGLIIGVFLIIGLSLNVSATHYPNITIGNVTHVFTVVPGQWADITLPIIIRNIDASDPYRTLKGLQFNVTYNCSMINITNITHVEIVDVPGAPLTSIYNELCNRSPMPSGLRSVFCFFRNATPTLNRTNASILIATIRNTTHPDMCVLRIAFASYKNLTTTTTIGRIKMSVKPLPNYFAEKVTLPMNITVERIGVSKDVNINVTNATIRSQVKTDGLIKACRGDANGNGIVGEEDIGDIVLLSRYAMGPGSARFYDLTNISECLDVNGNGIVGEEDIGDIVLLSRYAMGPGSARFYNLTDIKF